MRERPQYIHLPRLRRGSTNYRDAITAARILVLNYVQKFSLEGGYVVKSVSIRNQKTRWGSCSHTKGLSFNYRIVYLPASLAEYIIVHELAHTKQHNHSSEFWKLVADPIPDYAIRRKELRRYQF